MGKSMTREERKSSKFIRRDNDRQRKAERYMSEDKPRREKPRPKWRPHSEIDAD